MIRSQAPRGCKTMYKYCHAPSDAERKKLRKNKSVNKCQKESPLIKVGLNTKICTGLTIETESQNETKWERMRQSFGSMSFKWLCM